MKRFSTNTVKAILLVVVAAICFVMAIGALKHFWWDPGDYGDMGAGVYVLVGALWLFLSLWCLVVAARFVHRR